MQVCGKGLTYLHYYATLCHSEHSIPAILVEGTEGTAIWNYSNELEVAMAKRENFSGIGVKWAEAGKRFIMEGYNEFNMFKNR